MCWNEDLDGTGDRIDLEMGGYEPLSIHLAGRGCLEIELDMVCLDEEEMLRARMEAKAGKGKDGKRVRHARELL